MTEVFSLKDRTAVITGGAGLYGRQIAEALAEAGARTIMASRDVAALDAQAETFRGRGLDVLARSLDQSEESSVRRLLGEAIAASTNGRIDVLVNNAVLRTMRGWGDAPDAFARSMAVNATGVYAMMKIFGDHMAADGRGGSIVNVGSIQGVIGPDFALYGGLPMDAPPDYFFHKGGMVQLTRYAAAKLGPSGVRVNCISPGGLRAGQPAAFVERYAARTMLRRMANESDLKGAIVFLASDASAYVTATNLPIDGGYTAM